MVRDALDQVLLPRRVTFWRGIAAGVMCVLIWGGQTVVTRRSVLDGLTPADVTILRFVVAGVVLLPLSLRYRPVPVGGLGWWRGIILAVLAGTPRSLALVGGAAFAPAADSAIVTFGVVPIVAAVLAYPAFGERPNAGKVGALAIILAGLVLFGWESFSRTRASRWPGYLLFVIAGAMWAGFSTLLRRWQVNPLSAASTISVLSLAGLPVCVVFLPIGLSHASVGAIALQAGYTGLLVGVVSIYLYVRAVVLLGPVRMGVLVSLVPVIASIAGAIVLTERPTLLEVGGMITVILGVVLSLLATRVVSVAQGYGQRKPAE